jgi:Putative MetA-pathway of phenol degradation
MSGIDPKRKYRSILGGSALLLLFLFFPEDIKAEPIDPLVETEATEIAEFVGPLVTDTAEPLQERQFSFQVTTSLFIKQGQYDQEGTLKYSPSGDRGYQSVTILKPYYGLFENFEVSAEFPLRYNWVTQSDRSAQDGGIGDILIGGKYRFVENDKKGPRPSISGIAKIKFPTGKYERLAEDRLGTDQTGNGSYEYIVGVDVSKFWEKWSLHGNLWYDWVAETTIDGIKTKPGNILYYNLAAERFLTDHWTALIELNGWEQGRTEMDGRMVDKSEARSLSLLPALEWCMSKKVFFILGCSIPILGKNTDYGFTPTLQFNYFF